MYKDYSLNKFYQRNEVVYDLNVDNSLQTSIDQSISIEAHADIKESEDLSLSHSMKIHDHFKGFSKIKM